MSRESIRLWSCILEKTSAQEESSNSDRSDKNYEDVSLRPDWLHYIKHTVERIITNDVIMNDYVHVET